MKARKLKSLLFAVSVCLYAVSAYSAMSLFSDYGQIQNVQNYSTNPFWTPNSPYNQKMPQPVYVQGNKVSTDECMQIVRSAVSVQCMARNNCKNTTLADIRPAIVVSLSSLPNKAYSTACIGYLDSVYESYVAQYGGNNTFKTDTVSTVVMPTTTTNVVQGSGIVLQNPFVKTDPQWKQDIADRAQELKSLQRQNNSGDWKLSASQFPNTINDLSFSDQIAIKAADYANYKGTTAYRTLKVENAHEWCNGKGAGSHECQEYFCEEKDGPKANTAECIKYRCETKTGYKDSHKEECACGVNPSSDTCKDYMCSDENKNSNYANSKECHTHRCKRDYKYREAHKKQCVCEDNPNSEECMMQKCYNSANKPNPNGGTGCEAWLCQNDTKYRKDNQQACICAENSKSYECLSLKCYTTGQKKDGKKTVKQKVPNDALSECKMHLCTYDTDYIDKHGEDCACLKEPYGKLCAQYKCFKDGKYSANIDDWVYKDRQSGAYNCCAVYCDANKESAKKIECGCNISDAFGGSDEGVKTAGARGVGGVADKGIVLDPIDNYLIETNYTDYDPNIASVDLAGLEKTLQRNGEIASLLSDLSKSENKKVRTADVVSKLSKIIKSLPHSLGAPVLYANAEHSDTGVVFKLSSEIETGETSDTNEAQTQTVNYYFNTLDIMNHMDLPFAIMMTNKEILGDSIISTNTYRYNFIPKNSDCADVISYGTIYDYKSLNTKGKTVLKLADDDEFYVSAQTGIIIRNPYSNIFTSDKAPDVMYMLTNFSDINAKVTQLADVLKGTDCRDRYLYLVIPMNDTGAVTQLYNVTRMQIVSKGIKIR